MTAAGLLDPPEVEPIDVPVPGRPHAEAPPAALYLHVPFCVSHCPYCDFVVVAGKEARGPANRIEAFVAALEVELGLRADRLDRRWGAPGPGTAEVPRARAPLASVYLGGGTPSLLAAPTLARLLELVRRRFGLASDAEVTLEANPGPDERGHAGAIRDAGVTRLSIGAQSFDLGELRRLGRRHSPADIADAVAEARAAAIPSISLDLLYDVPGQDPESWSRTLDAALRLEPDHLSLYALTLDDPDAEGLTGASGDHLPLRPGTRRWRERARPLQDDDRAAAMYELADRRLAAAGFAWYEISNWSRPGHQSRHNLAYWSDVPYEGVGPGAHAFEGARRRWNAARLDTYLAALVPPDGSPPGLPPGGHDSEGPADRARDAAILALRTSAGLPATALDDPTLGPVLSWARDAELLDRLGDDHLVLTLRGRLLSNELFARLV